MPLLLLPYNFFSTYVNYLKIAGVLNKERVIKLIDQGLMNSTGMEMIEIAKGNGSWTALDKIENLELPVDLKAALKQNPQATKHFETFPRSVKKGILQWI